MSTITADALEPYVSQQDDPWWYGDSLFEFLIPSHATGGQIAVFRSTMPQGFSPPRHIHTREDEVFLVEAGDACFEIAGRRVPAGPGTSRPWPADGPNGAAGRRALRGVRSLGWRPSRRTYLA